MATTILFLLLGMLTVYAVPRLINASHDHMHRIDLMAGDE
jgi:hypothetical protein